VLWSRPRLPTSRPKGKPPLRRQGPEHEKSTRHSQAVEVFHLAMQQGFTVTHGLLLREVSRNEAISPTGCLYFFSTSTWDSGWGKHNAIKTVAVPDGPGWRV
jgi:hypothetical protein